MKDDIILIGHGSGGRLSRDLIDSVFRTFFSNPALDILSDAAIVSINGQHIAFTTDSYVIDPLFFPGGDIGKLAVSGTINDLCVSGAIPKYITAGFIIEEGFSVSDLQVIAKSMAIEAKNAGIYIVAGDTKVVKRGQCDKLFINTSGIGILPDDRLHINDGSTITPGDKILVTGTLGDHAISILAVRENLTFEEEIRSDVAPLNALVEQVLKKPSYIHFMRDITRGGLATILVESCQNKPFGIHIYEEKIPVRPGVMAVCDLYGFDPLYLANEGKIMMVVKEGEEENILREMHNSKLGGDATIIGEITARYPQQVVMESSIGGKRIIEMLSGEMLPRIC